MRRLFSALVLLAASCAVITSCGLPPEPGEKLATVKHALTVQPVSILDMPTATNTALFFRPELPDNLKAWPDAIKRLNALTEWVKDHSDKFKARVLYRPFFYRAEFLFHPDEYWDLVSRTNSADTSRFGTYDEYGKERYHEGDDWNRYGANPTLQKQSGYNGDYDHNAPMTSPCTGTLMYNANSGTSFGKQAYVLCKFLAPWRTRADGYQPLLDGYEFVAFKSSHLEQLAKQAVGSRINLGDDLGTVGGSGHTNKDWPYHIHSAFHRESMLTRCKADGTETTVGNYICVRHYSGGDTTTYWPTSGSGDHGFSFIRANYYDPLEFIKARSGRLLYSKQLETTSAQGGELLTHKIGPIKSGRTIVITLNNRDYPRRGTTDEPPLTKILIYSNGSTLVLSGGEQWNDQDRRAVIRNVAKSDSWFTVKVLTKGRSDGKGTLKNAHFQLYITEFQNSTPTLGHYGKRTAYPVIPRRSGLGTNLGVIYLNNRDADTDDKRNHLRLFKYLQVAYDHALLTCQSRYQCNYNRFLTRCEVAIKLANFMNYEVSENPISTPFSDYDKMSKECFLAAYALYKAKVVLRPYNNTTTFPFNPDQLANRADTVAMIVRAFWSEPAQNQPSPFSDVAPDAWYAPYIIKASQEGLLKGCETGKACPGTNMPEAHFLIMLMRYMGLDDNVKASSTTYSAVHQRLVERDGVGGGYCSGCTCTPGQVALCGTGTGSCQEGVFKCVNGKWDTSTCVGEVKPKPEECNGLDDDCDGMVDNVKGTTKKLTKQYSIPDCAAQCEQTCDNGQWTNCSLDNCSKSGPGCKDDDKDGYGDGASCIAKDCDDSDPNKNPAKIEVCDGLDNDCDGLPDNIAGTQDKLTRGCYTAPCGNSGKQTCVDGKWSTCDAQTCPDPCIDKDNDGFFENPSDHCPGPKDCDDSDPTVYPGAPENCNGKDNNCDGHKDNETKDDPAPLTTYCYKPPCAGKVPIRCQGGKWELCSIQNCPACIDRDGDGFKIGGANCGKPDCDDEDKNKGPGATEICNGQDDDCDGKPDNQPGTDNSITRPCYLNCGDKGTQTCTNGQWTKCEGSCLPCEDNDKDGMKKGSPLCGPIDCKDDNASVYPGAQEKCDGLDNDCDGMIDNFGPNQSLKKPCVNSQCGSSGSHTCQDGKWSSCSAVCTCEDKDKDGFRVGGPHCGLIDCDDSDFSKNPFNIESCDGKDNDCNGKVDDGIQCLCILGQTKPCYTGPAGTANKGICREGTQKCISNGAGGTKWDTCSGEVKPKAETCNTIDDDCNGKVDDGIQCTCTNGQIQACGTDVGECTKGQQICVGNKWTSCTSLKPPTPEVCDGKDNDCDGQVDENLTQSCYTGPAGSAGKGICKQGYKTCTNGQWSSTCLGQITPLQEQCDGADNDCDGQVDESLTRSCYSGPSGTKGIGECKEGTQTCNNGNWGTCVGEGRPTTDVCDGKDNDCDGFTDNKAGTNQRLSRPCTRKPCGYQGIEACMKGVWDSSTCSAGTCPPAPCTDADGDGYDGTGGPHCNADCNDKDPLIHPGAREVCDGKDNNCDGKIDRDASNNPVTQTCFVPPCYSAGTQTCNMTTKAWGPCLNAKPCPVCEDKDKDGYGLNGSSDCQYPGKKDCNDNDPNVNPGAKEQCNRIDDDCDGTKDNIKGTSQILVGNCAIAPCGNPGTRQCFAGQWQPCQGQSCTTCGNGKQDPGETCLNCPQDIKCPNGQSCNPYGSCVYLCGNGKTDPGENCTSCPQDVKCTAPNVCQSGQCVPPANPCSSCTSGQVCYNNACCTPSCSSLSCGSDGCGQTCQCPNGYSCNTGTKQCESQCSCVGKQCGLDSCNQRSCGTCPSGTTCNSSGQCDPTPTCNCNSSEYCDGTTCKSRFTVSTVGSGCTTINAVTLCLSSDSSRCDSSGCRFEVVKQSGNWSGNAIDIFMRNASAYPRNCYQNFTSTSTSSSSNKAPPSGGLYLNLGCLKAGEYATFSAEVYSPAGCRAGACSFNTGSIKITRNK